MKRSIRLLSLLAVALLLLGACTSAEESTTSGTEGLEGVTEEESPTPGPVEELSEEVSEPTTASEDAGADTSSSGRSLADVAADNPQLSQLVTALEAAGLTSALQDVGPLTVFAPNNDAFASLDRTDLTELLANPQQLGDILRFHVVEGAVTSSDMEDGQTLTTLEGSDLTVSVDGSTISVDGATVVEPDIEAGNGVIHIIDGVIRPPSS